MPNMKTVGQRHFKLLSGQASLVKAPVTLIFDPVTSISLAVIYKSRLSSIPNMMAGDQSNLKLLGGQGRFVKATVTLTIKQMTTNSIGVIY
jgi:hypothetical protein